MQQRALADAVVADDSDPVAAHDAQREVLQQRPPVVAVRDVANLDDLAPGDFARLVDLNARRARALDARRAHLAQLLERAHASLVARLARLDALANPDSLPRRASCRTARSADPRPRRSCAFLRQIVAVAAGPAAQLAAIDVDDARGDLLDEAAVVRDEQNGAGMSSHGVLEPFDRTDVEMIGRLVEQQQLRVRDERLGERRAPPPAAGQLAHAVIGRQAELADDGCDAHVDVPAAAGVDFALQGFDFAQRGSVVGAVAVSRSNSAMRCELTGHAARHEVADELGRFVGELLLEQAPAQTSGLLDGAVVGLLGAGDQLQRRRLAGAVAADQAHALAGLDREIGVDEDSLLAEGDRNGVEAHQRGHGKTSGS